jgi:ribose transport system ATP-binding protein
MQEIDRLCDVVTVMRNGADVGTVRPAETTIDRIIAMMIARDVGAMFPQRKAAIGEPLLEISDLGLAGKFRNVSFAVRRGEIVGITGLLGSGVKEIVHCLFGLASADHGTIAVAGKTVRPASPHDAVAAGLALLPEDRRAHGIALDLSVRENISLASLGRYSRNGLVRRGEEAREIDALIRDLTIKTPGRDVLVRQLSGGNQQKVSLAKWLSCRSRVYVLDEPTVAVDIAAKVEIYSLLNRLAESGAAVLMLSSDLLELTGMCDRVLAVYRGGLAGEFSGASLDGDRLLAASSGASRPSEMEAA